MKNNNRTTLIKSLNCFSEFYGQEKITRGQQEKKNLSVETEFRRNNKTTSPDEKSLPISTFTTQERPVKKLIVCACLLVMVLSSCTQKDAIIWMASPWQQVMRSTPPGESRSATLKVAANEYEPFRIIIHNISDHTLNDITVSVRDLRSNKVKIPADNKH